VLAAETLIPPAGGAERFWLELAESLAKRHRVRAFAFDAGEADGSVPAGVEWIGLEAPAHGADWSARRLRRRALADALSDALTRRRADVVAGQLHAGPAAVTAARAVGAASILFVPGYEAVCHWAFGVRSACRPETRCRGCPRALALGTREREARWAERDAQDEALAAASELVAPSRPMADTVERACGRRPHVVAPVGRAPHPVTPDRDGHIATLASFWTVDKGVELLAPIARLVPDRPVVVQVPPPGLRADVRAELEALPNAILRPPPGTIEDVLDGAALLLVPSQIEETFGRVAFEGMAAGVPVLASDVGGMRETVPAVQRVSPHTDPPAWAAAIRRQLRPERWGAAQSAGREAAERVLGTRPLDQAERIMRAAAARRSAAAPSSV
jgi:glycosyltransferase involved in cell wall biosynthesis